MVCPLRPASLASFVAALALATPLAAQCGLDWLPGPAASGPLGAVYATLALPNGELVAGGQFVIADSAFANNIARWNGTTWLPLGAGVGGRVSALARLPNGDIVAAGSFITAGGLTASNIALWNGSSWAPLGPGLDALVNSLLVMPNGTLVAGGRFLNAGATQTNLVAQWNGVSWSTIGGGFPQGEVTSLALMPNGDIIAGGNVAQGITFWPLQRWDGVSWQPVPGLDPWSTVDDVAVRPNGDLVATGTMSINSVTARVVRYDGVTMQSLNPPPTVSPRALIARANGDVWIGQYASGLGAQSLQRWDGTSWTAVAGGPLSVAAFAEDSSGRLLVGADLVSTIDRGTVTRWNGVNWQAIGAPKPPIVRAMVRLPNGDVVVGGSFASFGGVAATNLARWNGSVWLPLGVGVDGPVYALAAAPNGDVVVSGAFANAGGAPANRVARWNGQVWSTLGGGLAIDAFLLATGSTGEILAGGGYPHGVHRFDGLTWGPLTLPSYSSILALVSLPDSSFALGGQFGGSATGVALASGSTVTFLAGAPTVVLELLVDSRGGLVASSGANLQRWDGTTWTSLPALNLTGLGELPNGELVATSGFQSVGGGAASCVYRLRSSGWQSFGDVRPASASSYPTAITASGRGDLFVAGAVASASNTVSVGFAHAVPTCPAAASIVGAGCTGGAGPVTLVTNNVPWVGGVFTATASGMTTSSLALQVLGSSTPAMPLPGGAPGCSLFVAPILMDLLLPSAGIATSAWAVPAAPGLAGLQVRLQVVGIELGAAGIVRLTSTNALELTIGML